MSLLDVRIERADYGGWPVLHDVALDVNSGELVAVLGANGAGKTTLLRAISGVMVRMTGELTLEGTSLSHAAAHERVAMGVGHVPEGRRVFGGLSVRENLRMGAYARRRNGEREIEESIQRAYELFPILGERRGQLGSTLSGGEQQMLAIARGLMANPRVLMVDEASLGLAPLVAQHVLETLATIAANGTAVIAVEQNAVAMLEVADRAYVFERGRIALAGMASELRRQPEVVNAYLGGGRQPAKSGAKPSSRAGSGTQRARTNSGHVRRSGTAATTRAKETGRVRSKEG